jgi:2-polyprenyl-3-methyl-5-hydroxy-6-metoxy-1,4-benzoquinol methylase
MREYYEDLWQRLPAELEPPGLNLRLEHLRAGVCPGDRALDLGCGDGLFTEELARTGAAATGADVAQAALDRARARHPQLDFRLAQIDGPLPFDDGSFDVVWASEVIEHVADTARWLSELRRVMSPGGRLLLTTPNHPRAFLLVRGIERYSNPLSDHLHLYTRHSMHGLLNEFGFEPVQVRTAGGPPLFRRLLLARAVRS